MKVTYSMPTYTDLTVSDLAIRVLTQNLLNNDKIDAHFPNDIFNISNRMQIDSFEIMKQLKFNLRKMAGNGFTRLLRLALTDEYNDILLNSIKGDYFLYSVHTVYDYSVISYLMNKGVKCIIGGVAINSTSIKDAREKLAFSGAKNMNNVIIVKGYITPYTNIHKIIKEWKDIEIPNENLDSIFEAKNDYSRMGIGQSIRNILNSMKGYSVVKNIVWPDNVVSIMFNDKCFWSKCRFCMYNPNKNVSFSDNLTAEEIIKHILETCHNLSSDAVFFADEFFILNEKSTEVVKRLKEHGIKMLCQTGILLMENEEYAKLILDNFYGFSLGIETMTDFGLNYINKGFKYENIMNVFNIIKENYNDNIISFNMINDVPCEDLENLHLNYNRMVDIKNKSVDLDMKFDICFRTLNIYSQKINEFLDLGYIRLPKEETYSGRYYFWNDFKKLRHLPQMLKFDGVPFERIDKNGNLIPSDFEIIDAKTFKLIQRKEKKFFNKDRKERRYPDLKYI